MAEERSRDRSSSAESQPKFPGCSHFRCRNDNHLRCQQFRLNEGQSLCTQDSPCLVCKLGLVAWGAGCASQGQRSEKSTQGRSGGEGSQESWRDHGRFRGDTRSGRGDSTSFQAFQVRGIVQDEADENQSHDVWILSTQVRGFQCLGGGTAQLSRVGPPQVQESRAQAKTQGRQIRILRDIRRDGSRRESERSRPSSSGGSSSQRRAESGSVSKVSDTRPSASSSRHHHHSSGDRRSLSSTSSRASPDRRSLPSHERRRESADRTGQTYITRRDVKLSPKNSKPPEKRTITVVSSPARQVHVESAQSRQRRQTARQVPTRQQAMARTQVAARQHATAQPQATTRPQVTVQIQVTARHRGRAAHSGRPSQWRPSGCLGSWVRATVWWTGWDGRPSTPSNRSTTWNPGSYLARGWTTHLQVYRDQQPAFPFHPEIHQSGNAGRLYVNVDVTTASDGPVQCSSCSSLSSRPVSSSGSQTWLNQQEISHAG